VNDATAHLRPGDTLVVWRLDRLGRSLGPRIATVPALADRGIGFRSLTEQIDTTTSGGTLIFHDSGALVEFERDLIRERTHAGLAAARARGRVGGRPKKLADPKQLALARRLHADGETDVATICRTLGISRATLYQALKADPSPTREGGLRWRYWAGCRHRNISRGLVATFSRANGTAYDTRRNPCD
jgi:DNA invertase Pin-like site-specific DNA recombinase